MPSTRQSVHVEGMKELDRALKRLPATVAQTMLVDALEAGAEEIAEQARANAPYDPTSDGKPHLKDNIGVGNAKQRGDTASVDVGVDYKKVRYGHLVEFGHKGGARAHPFMRPAFDSKAGDAVNTIKADLWKGLLRATHGRR